MASEYIVLHMFLAWHLKTSWACAISYQENQVVGAVVEYSQHASGDRVPCLEELVHRVEVPYAF